MTCQQVCANLWLYVDRELKGEVSCRLEHYLQQCHSCFANAAGESQWRALLRDACGRDRGPAAPRERLGKLVLR